MNNDIAGNITSLVSGLEDIFAAVAKELNATSTVTLILVRQLSTRVDTEGKRTRNASPERRVHGLYSSESEFRRDPIS
jgi:hypothetical protein